jgi:hypothetical protein
MLEIHPLPFQQELVSIATSISDLAKVVHPESDLAEALDRAAAILEPYYGTVEFMTPVTLEEIHFRSYLSGMKL